ncbi:MAG: phosphate acyltransferase PlsX [Actinomycetia bacterium]|nr:phosphate acyltransferase PlsX [Actinomycetes bacterium]
MARVRVAVDAMGGDRAPEAIVEGSRTVASSAVMPTLFGPSDLLAASSSGLAVRHAPLVVGMEEKPADVAREKRESSLFAACRAVGEGEADVAVSAGNTGAMLVAALLEIGRLPGVLRPAIAVPIPGRQGPSVLIDAGANADARPEQLVQFAHMGAIFAEEVVGLVEPTVGLLSIGEEPEKGNRLTQEAHALLAVEDALNFVGNVESRLILERAADVVVTDGFVGNMALKMLEGTIRTTLELIRDEIVSTRRGRLGGLLIRPAARRLRTRFDPEVHGGAYLLGLNGLVVIAHGNSTDRAFANAISLGVRGVQAGVSERVSDRLPATVAPSVSSA